MSFLRNSIPMNHIMRYTVILMMMWTLVLIMLAIMAIQNNNQATILTAQIEARASFEKDLLYRRWASIHGGVYVPLTEDTPPNPYLNVPNKVVTTTDGLELTLMNPAYMSRQVYEILEQQGNVRGHITSLNPIRPENLPDDWEREALTQFATGETQELTAIDTLDGVLMMRYIRAMVTEESCLKCHAFQGYEIGDIRGGISVSVPLAPYFAARSVAQNSIIANHGFLWILGMLGILIGSHRIRIIARQDQVIVKQLAQSEVRYRQMFEDNHAVMLLIDPITGHIGDANHAAVEFYGYSYEQLTSMTIQQINILSDAEVRERLAQAKTGLKGYFEFQHRIASGEIRHVAVFATPVEMLTGSFLYSIIVDITAKFEAQLQQQKMINQMHYLNQTAMDMLTLVDFKRIFEYVAAQIYGLFRNVIVVISEQVESDAIVPCVVYGLSDAQIQYVSELMGQSLIGSIIPIPQPLSVSDSLVMSEESLLEWLSTVGPEDVAQQIITELNLKDIYSITLRKNEQIFAHVKILTTSEEKIESLTMIEALVWQASTTLQRLYIEHELRKSEERQRLTLMGTRAGTWEWNVQTGETIFNERWASIVGYTLQELEPISIVTWLNLVHPDDAPLSEHLLNEHFVGKSPYYECEVRMRHKEGHWVWVLDRGAVMEWTEDGKPLRMFGTHVDVTRRKEAEQALSTNEERLRMIVDNIPIMLSFFDENGRFELTNTFWEERLGWTAEDLNVYENPMELFYPDPEYRQTVIDYMKSAQPGWRDFQTHTRDKGVLTTTWANVRLSDGRGIGIGQDVTELRHVQQQQMALELEIERRHLLTSFIQNAAHEFRTPLAAINSSAYLMSRIDDAERRLEKSKHIETQVSSIGQLIHKLLLMTRLESNDEIEMVPVEIESLLQITCDSILTSCCENNKIRVMIEPNLPYVLGNTDLLDEAFVQVLHNACRYSSADGLVTVEAYQNEQEVHINIHDEGMGIAPEDMPHIFETFWRHDTAHSTPGFGLGLPIAQKIILRHRGYLELDSEPGKGTNVHIRLPFIAENS